MSSNLEPIPITSQKHDPAWKHCQMFKNEDKVQLKCIYCSKMFKGGGIHRIKEHLAGHKGNASTCLRVPPDVRLQMQQSLDGVVFKKRKKQKIADEITNLNPVSNEMDGFGSDQIDVNAGLEFIRAPNAIEPSSSLIISREQGISEKGPEKRKRGRAKGSATVANADVATNTNAIAAVNNSVQLAVRRPNDHVNTAIGRFLYDIGAPLDVVNSVYFQLMVDAIVAAGSEVVMPSYHDLRGWILKNSMEEVKNDMSKHTTTWTRTGCSVLVNQWTNVKNRTLLHFLVYCPEGVVFFKSVDASDIISSADSLYELLKEVVEEIGVGNVVQVITGIEDQYVVAGRMLCDTFPTLYWAPCASHSLDLILKDFSKLEWINTVIEQARSITRFVYNHSVVLNMLRRFTFGNDIIELGTTRFATNFATLKRMFDLKNTLQAMVTSQEWMDCPYAKKPGGLEMLDLISNESFWNSCEVIVHLTDPLLRALRIVVSKKRPAMGYVYAAMYRAKEAIKKEFFKRVDHMVYWKIIEHRWGKQWNLSLHAAGFYLNPRFFYSIEGDMHSEIQSGMFDCIEKLVPDIKVQDKIIKEISYYKSAAGDFGRKMSIRARETLLPVEWWSTYGGSCPNLARLAIRILSQTCSSVCNCQNQIPYEQMHGTTNYLESQRLNDLVFVQYNLRLRKQFGNNEEQDSMDPMSFDNIGNGEEWIKADELCQEEYINSEWMTLDPPLANTRPLGISPNEFEALGAGFDDYEIFNKVKEDEEVF